MGRWLKPDVRIRVVGHSLTHAMHHRSFSINVVAAVNSSRLFVFHYVRRRTCMQVYPLIAAMSFVTGMCVFQLARNVLMNPDVRVSKTSRQSAVLDNAGEGQRYSQHAFRRFLATQRPEVFPALNSFFSDSNNNNTPADKWPTDKFISSTVWWSYSYAARRPATTAPACL